MKRLKCNRHNLCVASVPIFSSLNCDELERVHNLVRKYHFQRGEQIKWGNDSRYFFLVAKGKLKVYRLTAAGKVQIIRFLQTGDFFGETNIFTGEISNYEIEVVEEAEICCIGQQDMEQILILNSSLALKLLKATARRLQEAEALIENLGLRDVVGRIAFVLCDLINKENAETIELPWSQKDLANMLATTQESISRKLGELEQMGLILMQPGRKIKAIDRAGLKKLAGK